MKKRTRSECFTLQVDPTLAMTSLNPPEKPDLNSSPTPKIKKPLILYHRRSQSVPGHTYRPCLVVLLLFIQDQLLVFAFQQREGYERNMSLSPLIKDSLASCHRQPLPLINENYS